LLENQRTDVVFFVCINTMQFFTLRKMIYLN